MSTTDNNRLSAQIHTYRCEDGIVRTRCTDHIPHGGAYAPIRHRAQLSSARTADRRYSCIACFYAQFDRIAES